MNRYVTKKSAFLLESIIACKQAISYSPFFKCKESFEYVGVVVNYTQGKVM